MNNSDILCKILPISNFWILITFLLLYCKWFRNSFLIYQQEFSGLHCLLLQICARSFLRCSWFCDGSCFSTDKPSEPWFQGSGARLCLFDSNSWSFCVKLDELCNHGLVTQAASLISNSSSGGGQASLSTLTYTGLIRLLSI